MTDANLTVEDDLVVSLDYTLRLDGGQVVDSSSGKEPLEFLHGRGSIVPGLEQALYGMADGEEKDVLLDFNHPLAGETLHFNVQIAGLRAATGEELEHGHVHDGGDQH